MEERFYDSDEDQPGEVTEQDRANGITEVILLAHMPYDHAFETEDGEQLCHATGRYVKDSTTNMWWTEYEYNGTLYYGG